MLNRLLIVSALMALPCFGAYNPKDIFFEFFVTQGKGYFPQYPHVASTVTAVMRNVPLYFISKDKTRDYIKNVSFFLAKNTDGTHDLRYKIISAQSSTEMVLKDVQKDTLTLALQDTFPNILSELGTILAGPDYEGQGVFTVESLYELKNSESNKERFLNCMKFINHFLPIDKLNFDEQDLYVTVPIEPASTYATGWRSWFSAKAWHNWLRGSR